MSVMIVRREQQVAPPLRLKLCFFQVGAVRQELPEQATTQEVSIQEERAVGGLSEDQHP